jgi:uncharacterized protein (TIGR01777 family)
MQYKLKAMDSKKMRIVIPGGSGQIGQLLARHFHSAGHRVTVLSRHPAPAPWQVLQWDARTPGPWAEALEGSDVCINLTGRSVNCRLTPENRRAIHDSRTDAAHVLNQVIATLASPPRVWLNASTATIYRHALDRPMDEFTGEIGGNEPGAPETWSFSVQVAKDWEEAFFSTSIPGTRKVAMRTTIAFNADPGSAFAIMSRLVRFGLGGAQGRGDQFVSWIHEADLIRAIEFLIERSDIDGPVNLAAPNPLPNKDFMRAFRQAWGMPVGLPAAAWMIEIGTFLIRTESELVLKSRRVVPGCLLAAGFQFQFPEWQLAVNDLVQRWRKR